MKVRVMAMMCEEYPICDEAWERLRADAHRYMKDKEETLLKNWLTSIGCSNNFTIGYYRDSLNKVMEIYSTRPGALIGKAGTNIDELKRMLSEEFRGEWQVKLVEVRGGFINYERN